MSLQWKVGDRAAFEHGMRHRGRVKSHIDHGTVAAIDEPGLGTGVRLVFDRPCPLGPTNCYATPRELHRLPKVRTSEDAP